MGDAKQVAEGFWKALSSNDWDGAAALTHDDYVQEWPQSGERIVGKVNALEINKNFPGGLPKMEFRRTLADGDLATVEVTLTYADGSVYQGVSILEVRDGKIAKETDYFAEPFAAPEWRAQWVERM